MSATTNPINFENVVKTKLPKGGKKVGVKWIYKTKFNENREVNKYNARLVANIVSIL